MAESTAGPDPAVPYYIGQSFVDQARLRLLATIQASRNAEALEQQVDYWRSVPAANSAQTLLPLDQIEDDASGFVALLPECQEIVESLAGRPLRAAREVWADPRDSEVAGLLVWRGRQGTNHAELFEATQEWATQWGWGSAEWFLDEALQTLARWTQDPKHEAQRLWEWPQLSVVRVPELGSPPGFNPFEESEAEFLERVRSEAKAHVAAAKADVKLEGLGSSPPRAEPLTYVWLLQAAAFKKSPDKITHLPKHLSGGRAARSIRRSVESLADHLDIDLGGRPVGRPKRA